MKKTNENMDHCPYCSLFTDETFEQDWRPLTEQSMMIGHITLGVVRQLIGNFGKDAPTRDKVKHPALITTLEPTDPNAEIITINKRPIRYCPICGLDLVKELES